MKKLRFDLNRFCAEKPENRKVTMPVEMELNERELATVAGGWGDCGWDDCGCHRRRFFHHHFRHHFHHDW